MARVNTNYYEQLGPLPAVWDRSGQPKKILFPVDRPTGYLFLFEKFEKEMKEINDHPY